MGLLYGLCYVLPLFLLVSGSHVDTWNGGYVTDETHNGMVEYHYYTGQKLSWNEARTVCQEIGGDLAKIDSKKVMDFILHVAEETFKENIFQNDYCLGLFEQTQGQRIWTTDCSALDYTDNYPDPFKDSERCFMHSHSDNVGQRKDCDNDHTFLCEKHTTQRCTLGSILIARYVGNVSVASSDACSDACKMDNACRAALYIPPSDCYKLGENGTNDNTNANSPISIGSKLCFQVFLNESKLNPPKDDSSIPNSHCNMSVVEVLSTTLLPEVTSTMLPEVTSTMLPEVTSTPVCETQTLFSSCDCLTSTLIQTTTVMTTLISSSCSLLTTMIAPSPTCPISSTSFTNLTDIEQYELAAEISKNLTVDAKKTSAYVRTLTSASDTRSSSTAMGLLGAFCVIVPLLLILLSDFKRMITDISKCRR